MPIKGQLYQGQRQLGNIFTVNVNTRTIVPREGQRKLGNIFTVITITRISALREGQQGIIFCH